MGARVESVIRQNNFYSVPADSVAAELNLTFLHFFFILAIYYYNVYNGLEGHGIFYGREAERKKLHTVFHSDEQMISLIYGRRRIGKSELIKQALKETDIAGIYYECKQTTEKNNVDSLAELIGDAFQFPTPAFKDMEQLLQFLFKKSEQEPLILVLDEYPYLRENTKGLDSILQFVINGYKDTSHMKLIICGSYVDTMKALLAGQNPLYGRIDLAINLKPMDYYDSALFYPSFSDEDKVRLFSVFGGIPYYNRLIDSKRNVRENVINLIASPGARLENEVSMYLNSEISKITNANEVFEALAKGFFRYKDLLGQSNVSSGPALVDILDKLIRMDVVAKEAPINNENNRNGLMEAPFEKIGKYCYDDPAEKKNGEFDIVTQDDRGYIFYEAKFWKDPVTESMVQNEIRQVAQTGLSCYKYGFFSRSGFLCSHEENRILIELKELYK